MNLHKFYTSLDKATQSLETNLIDKNAYVFGLWILWTTPEFGVSPILFIIYIFFLVGDTSVKQNMLDFRGEAKRVESLA